MTRIRSTLAAAACFTMLTSMAHAERVVGVRIVPLPNGQIATTTLLDSAGPAADCKRMNGGMKARMIAMDTQSGKPASPPILACWSFSEGQRQVVVHAGTDKGGVLVFKYPTSEFEGGAHRDTGVAAVMTKKFPQTGGRMSLQLFKHAGAVCPHMGADYRHAEMTVAASDGSTNYKGCWRLAGAFVMLEGASEDGSENVNYRIPANEFKFTTGDTISRLQ